MSATILTFPGVRRWESAPEQGKLVELPIPPMGELPAPPSCDACGRAATVWARFGFRCSACARVLVDPDLGGDAFLFTDVYEEETK